MATRKVQGREEGEHQENVQLQSPTSSTTKNSAAAGTKKSFYSLLVFLLLTAGLLAEGQMYTFVAPGALEATRTSSIVIKSKISRTDSPAVVTTTPTYNTSAYAPTSLPTQFLQTQPPTTRPSEPPKQQQEADDDQRMTVYSKLRTDRSGAAIQDMLYAHAYAFVNGMHYMGACSRGNHREQQDHQILLNAIGLNSTLRMACPAGGKSKQVFLNDKQYRKESYLRNEQWLKYIRSAVRCTKLDGADGGNVMQVAVHIRRGDVTPCVFGGKQTRYTPNSQYMDVLDRILHANDTLPKVQVRIFSEKESYEAFDVFTKKNYSLHLDTGIADVWRAMVTADVVVMAKSSFSFVPTLLNGNATVLYTPFWHPALPGWQNVSDEILKKASLDMRELHAQANCSNVFSS